MVRACKKCGGTSIEEDNQFGHTVCQTCGAVLEENKIVSDLQFQESSSGAHSMVGQFVSADQPSRVCGIGVFKMSGRESRETTLNNARRRFVEVGSQLRLNTTLMDMAHKFYSMALDQGITRGRRSMSVVASFLYMACRLEQVHLLLLDFSDAVQVNVFELGKMVSFYSRKLYITLPPTDPCLYVMRFASMLKFGDRENDVAQIALRLVSRMKRDWMAVGRRPTGICGAALLLAARYYQFNRTLTDIVRVVHIGESVLRKRLNEFDKTPSAALTLDEFVEVDLESAADPPAFTEGRARGVKIEETKTIAEQLAAEMDRQTAQVENALEQERRNKKRGDAGAPIDEAEQVSPSKRPTMALAGHDAHTSEELTQADEYLTTEFLKSVKDGQPSDGSGDDAQQQQPQIQLPQSSSQQGVGPSFASLGLDRNELKRPDVVDDAGDGELDLTGIDDDELEQYMFTADETAQKERIWMRINGTFMDEQARRRADRVEQEEKERNDPNYRPKTKPNRRKRNKNYVAATSGEAVEMIIQEKKLSSKINYDVLKQLVGPGVGMKMDSAAADTSAAAIAVELPSAPPAKAPKVEAYDTTLTVTRGAVVEAASPTKPVSAVVKKRYGKAKVNIKAGR